MDILDTATSYSLNPRPFSKAVCMEHQVGLSHTVTLSNITTKLATANRSRVSIRLVQTMSLCSSMTPEVTVNSCPLLSFVTLRNLVALYHITYVGVC